MPVAPQAEAKSLGLFRQLVALVVLLLILAVLAQRYFNGVNNVSSQSLALEHNRLVNVLAMVRSQWQSLGRPSEMQADWLMHDQGVSRLTMARGGWPTVTENSAAGCEQLWTQLLGITPAQAEISVNFEPQAQRCQFIAMSGQRLEYQLDNGQLHYFAEIAN
ncbi:hypothetical protein L9G15_01630 [Shewanella sp. A3A]|nr:hypothetical protein [Shewanella ferrihydritica]